MLLGFVLFPILGGLFGFIGESLINKFWISNNLNLSHSASPLQKFKHFLYFEIRHYFSFWIALLTALIIFAILIYLSIQVQGVSNIAEWRKEICYDWIQIIGIQFHLRLESISLLICLLTSFLTVIALIYSHKERQKNSALFFISLLSMNAFTMMLVMAQDLFLFFFLWEIITIPFYFSMVLWGRKTATLRMRFNGASKFIIYTQTSAVIMLIAILTLALKNQHITDTWTFNYIALSKTPISIYLESTLLIGFLIVFFIRLPLFPFQSWFIEAHKNSSTTGSIMLSGLFCVSTIYCFMKFVFLLFPNALFFMQTGIMAITLMTTFFGALVCFKQENIKQLIAYAHLSLIGLIMSIIFCQSLFALQGVILLLIGISFSITGLFILSHLFTEIYKTQDIYKMKQIQISTKLLATLMVFFILLLTGLPGSANFTGILMMIIGSFDFSPAYVIFLAIALLFLATALIVRVQPLFYGEKIIYQNYSSRHHRFETILLVIILIILFYIGLMPQWILDMSYPWLLKIKVIIENTQANIIRGQI